jgi:hypothetical protein
MYTQSPDVMKISGLNSLRDNAINRYNIKAGLFQINGGMNLRFSIEQLGQLEARRAILRASQGL